MRKIITKAIALLIAFSTVTLAQEKGSFTDTRDKKTYKTVKIGEQVWMAENLNYADKDSKCNGERGQVQIPGGPYGSVKVVTLSKAEFEANCAKYGRLYDWETAMKACPQSWHLPSNAEWKQLTYFVGGARTAGTKLRATSGWGAGTGNSTDDYGFSALPGGDQTWGAGYHNGFWWSSTENGPGGAYYWYIGQNNYVDKSGRIKNNNFTSVRCVQGEAGEVAKRDSIAEAALKAKAGKVKKGSFTDARDNKTYKTVKLDNQIWMAENLNYAAEKTKCGNDKPENCTKYGRLYNWSTAKSACPKDWHLPSNEEWRVLLDFAGGYKAGNKLKATNGWNNNGEDAFGFSALNDNTLASRWWSSSTTDKADAIWWNIEDESDGDVVNGPAGSQLNEFYSVRCLQGDAPKDAPATKQAEQPKPADPPKQAEQPKKADPPKQQSSTEFCNITFPKKACIEMPKGTCKLSGGKVVDKCK
jgi:uncharacterized protein (TIGR02145 family)